MAIYKTGCDDPAASVDPLAPTLFYPSDLDYLAVLDPDVPEVPGVPRPIHQMTILDHEVQHRHPLPDFPACLHPRLLHSTFLPNNVHLIVQIHRAADMVGDYLQRVPHFEIADLVHSEQPMPLREPLQ